MKKKIDGMAASGNEKPRVAIFWLLGDSTLLLETTPLADAEPYGECLTHPRSHIDQWEIFRREGRVALDIEYEEPPRGRVVYNLRTEEFVIYADRCILRRKLIIRRIMAAMHLLSRTTEVKTDAHYRCQSCLDTAGN
jgi:hypothetical protein